MVREIVEEKDGKIPQIRFGPIPNGTTINLLMNLNLTKGNFREVAKLLIKVKKELLATKDMDPAQRRQHMEQNLKPILLENNLCPDFAMDKGHTFADGLFDDDKRSLIKLLATF